MKASVRESSKRLRRRALSLVRKFVRRIAVRQSPIPILEFSQDSMELRGRKWGLLIGQLLFEKRVDNAQRR
jgi:hypothetical protein